MTQRLTMKNRNRNIMLALDATSFVGSIVATTMIIIPVQNNAPMGVLRTLSI